MIEKFTKEIFETNMIGNGIEIIPIGLNLGEYCYLVNVEKDIFVYIRSSVHYNNKSANVAEDSIRVYLVRYDGRNIKMLSGSATKWTNRTPGWSKRTIELIENVKKWYHVCDCGEVMPIMKSKQPQSKGKIFCNCPKRKCKKFHWLS